jgi:hypothetical protein
MPDAVQSKHEFVSVQADEAPDIRESNSKGAIVEHHERLHHSRLARECEKLDQVEEQQLAEENLVEEVKAWPEWERAPVSCAAP